MDTPRSPLDAVLPVFPWDTLADAAARVRQHPHGGIDLSVGTPVDQVDERLQQALASAAAIPGYPTTAGIPELREAIVAALTRRYGIVELSADHAVLPLAGTKECIASLPSQLGLSSAHSVIIPEIAYPTYEVGALLAGCEVIRSDRFAQDKTVLADYDTTPGLLFLNSPSNPTGRVLSVDELREIVQWAREHHVIVASDECYIGLAWDEPAVSILDPRVCDGDTTGLLALHSLSKTSNMASYRAGCLVGDEDLIQELLRVRKHLGVMIPVAVQAAMTAAWNDDEHAVQQYERYRRRREMLRAAIEQAGWTIEQSSAGLYLWVTRGTSCRELVDYCAERGILVAPGEFYGPGGTQHVRIALTATDEDIANACQRLTTGD